MRIWTECIGCKLTPIYSIYDEDELAKQYEVEEQEIKLKWVLMFLIHTLIPHTFTYGDWTV